MAAKDQSRKKTPARAKAADLPARVLDTALEMAEETGWAPLTLSEVAARLGVPLAEILAHYRDKDAVADAWFGRALAAMLEAPPAHFADLPAKERLYLLFLRWFDALVPHREVTGQMLKEKLYPAHPHHWVPMIFNLSRTIQWLRDAAGLEARGRRRQMEEVGLTALFLATLPVWLADDGPDQARTRDFLRTRLDQADRTMARLCSRRESGVEAA
jgi:AcrR family transcriptional regulator